MELSDLVGKHWLTGVDMSNESVNTWGGYFESCEVIRFVLDGKTYTAVEDPADGYRSSMREINVSEDKVSNTFQATEVAGTMKVDEYEQNDVIQFTDIANGKVVLSVGTGNTDDYYPYWVAEWTPENLNLNRNVIGD